jgi:hypothetical protein
MVSYHTTLNIAVESARLEYQAEVKIYRTVDDKLMITVKNK